MIKAMVVDDERLVRKGFISLIDWSSYGIVIVGEAGDGKSALELLEQTEVDLLFADITMPGMSGFDLLEQVRRQYPHIHSVVLTCHHEFDFIQQALRLGAIDYIVKTLLEMESVEKVMRRIIERIEWEEGSRIVYHAIKQEKRFPSVDAILFRAKAADLKGGELYRLPIVQKNTVLEWDDFWLVPLIHPIPQEELALELREHVNPRWQAALLTDLKERQLEDIKRTVEDNLETLLFYAEESTGWSKIGYDELLGLKALGTAEVESMLYELKWTLYAGEREILLQTIPEQRPDPEVFMRFGDWLRSNWEEALLISEDAGMLADELDHNRTWSDWKAWLRRFSDGVKARMIDLGMSREVLYCLIRAMDFMRMHAGKKINQREVSAHVNMSRSYFSQCFAKFAGESFGERLRRMRIERAKTLLLETGIPIYEIASKTGFEDEKYFSRLFRERVGRSPSEFRGGSIN